MARILIVYHSQTGHTKRMALAVAEGVCGIEKAAALLKWAEDATSEDLLTVYGQPRLLQCCFTTLSFPAALQ